MYNDDFDDEDYCGYEEDDNERDLFYTLTDGQYGVTSQHPYGHE